jgi:glucose/arabinose dehydrogenase
MRIAAAVCVLTSACVAPAQGPDGLVVREGYQVTPAISDLPGARFMEFDDKGTLYVSRPDSGDIVAFRSPKNDGKYEKVGTFVAGKPSVHGLCFRDGWLWFTTSGTVNKAQDKDGDGKADEVIEVVGGLPKGGHWWRSIFVAEDGFFTSIGDSGNITDEMKSDRQKIWKYSLDGKERELFISGIRNTEKLRYRPGTTELWGLDHGSDWFGAKVGDKEGSQPVTDLNPPDEFNKYVKGGFYGHPFVVGNRQVRFEYMDRPDIHELALRTTPPEWCIGAHWATNGFTFLDPALNAKTGAFPVDHGGDAFIAAHGSWNSSLRVGYCIARIVFDKDPVLGGHPCGLVKIVSGLDGRGYHMRPADVVQAPDGSILFSTDDPGKVYRLTYTGTEGTHAK